MNDLVSIIMPSYNTAPYIAAAVRSVLDQTYSDWELLIVDDCSDDDTEKVLQPFLSDGRVRFFKNDTNSGAAVSRNRALCEAKGQWIAFLDSDDVWLPEKLERQLSFMKDRPCAFSYTEYTEIDEHDASLGVRVTGPGHITKAGMYAYCWPGCLTVMYNRAAVGDIQIADIRKNNDYAMWLKVSEKADCCLYPVVTAKYRRRAGSVSGGGYLSLVRWHYRLFHDAVGKSVLSALFHTGVNIVFGTFKKIFYVKRGDRSCVK